MPADERRSKSAMTLIVERQDLTTWIGRQVEDRNELLAHQTTRLPVLDMERLLENQKTPQPSFQG